MNDHAEPLFPANPVRRREPREHFRSGATALPQTLLDFWQWSSSDLVSNIARVDEPRDHL